MWHSVANLDQGHRGGEHRRRSRPESAPRGAVTFFGNGLGAASNGRRMGRHSLIAAMGRADPGDVGRGECPPRRRQQPPGPRLPPGGGRPTSCSGSAGDYTGSGKRRRRRLRAPGGQTPHAGGSHPGGTDGARCAPHGGTNP